MPNPNFTETMQAEHGDIGIATIAMPDEQVELPQADPEPTPPPSMPDVQIDETGRELIEYKYDRIVGDTEKQVRFDFGGSLAWLPKSRIAVDPAKRVVAVEAWLAERALGNLMFLDDNIADID